MYFYFSDLISKTRRSDIPKTGILQTTGIFWPTSHELQPESGLQRRQNWQWSRRPFHFPCRDARSLPRNVKRVRILFSFIRIPFKLAKKIFHSRTFYSSQFRRRRVQRKNRRRSRPNRNTQIRNNRRLRRINRFLLDDYDYFY